MKVWREFGSSHSANVTVIGEFENGEKVQESLPLIEDFAKGVGSSIRGRGGIC